MKEMEYTKNRTREVLDSGYYFGLLYYILNLGTHPTAYVKIPEDHWLFDIQDYNDMPIECHGGLTFCENELRIEENLSVTGKFIGWDYGHAGDYFPYDEILTNKGKKWTTQEIKQEVKEVCSQIISLREKKPDAVSFNKFKEIFEAGKRAKESEIIALYEWLNIIQEEKIDKKLLKELLNDLITED